ncbi:MAG: hypothetical protein ACRCTY_10510, partial [Candidatus Adiutrix sp.]
MLKYAELGRNFGGKTPNGPKKRVFNVLGHNLGDALPPNMLTQLALVALLTALTVLLSFPTAAPILKVGEVATHTIRADRSLTIVDNTKIEAKKAEIIAGLPPVFILDDQYFQLVEEQATAIFSQGRAILAALDSPPHPSDFAPNFDSVRSSFYQTFNLAPETQVWPSLVARKFDQTLEKLALELAHEIMAQGLLSHTLPYVGQWNNPATIIVSSTYTEYTVPSVRGLLDIEAAHHYLNSKIRLIQQRFPPQDLELVKHLALGLLRPNLKADSAETQRRLAAAAATVPDLYVDIRAGEVIVREGTIITPDIEHKLRAILNDANRLNHLWKFMGLFVVLFVFFNAGLILAHLSLNKGALGKIPLKEQFLVTLLLALVAIMSYLAGAFGASLSLEFDFIDSRTFFYATPFAAISMLAAIFFGLRRAAFVAMFAAMTAAIVAPGDKFIIFLYTYNGSIAAIWCLRKMNERGHLIPASFWVLLINCLTFLGLTLFLDPQWGRQTFNNFCAAAFSGILSGIIASGMVPLIELIFGFSTNMKMLELGNLDRPILRNLMLSAPGTYHHSVIVGAMVEAAAEAISANP